MKTGKRSLMSTFVAVVGLFGLAAFATEVQARPYHGHHYARHAGRVAAPQAQCTDLFGDCSNSNATASTGWDPVNGYTNEQPTTRATRKASRHARYAAPESESTDSWGWSGGSNVLSRAQAYMGMSERGNRGSLTRTLGVDPARTPWCAAWANAVLRQSGHRGTGSNMARSFYRYGTPSNGNAGDIAVMPHHVGFVAGTSYRNGRKYVSVIAGNTSNRVKTVWYPASRIAFRDPN